MIADGKTKVYGDADPSLTYQVSGRTPPFHGGNRGSSPLGDAIAGIAQLVEHDLAKVGVASFIEDHYLAKGWTRRDLERHIHKLMCDRYLRRGYAI